MVDVDNDEGGMSGTFRWRKSHKFIQMPSCQSQQVNYEKGWMDYLLSRGGPKLVSEAQEHLSLIDCLSFPLSIIRIVCKMRYFEVKSVSPDATKTIYLLCLGCSQKAEERVLRKTNCFNEILNFFSQRDIGITDIRLILIGPEIAQTSNLKSHIANGITLKPSTFSGTAKQFLTEHSEVMRLCMNPSAPNWPSVIFIGFNCGFGNFENPLPGRYELLQSWYPDLSLLISLSANAPCFFTCANDYCDVAGETNLMMTLFGGCFSPASIPQKNGFALASTFIPPDRDQSSSDFSCGNSFWYGIIGCDSLRKRKVNWPTGDRMSRSLAVQDFLANLGEVDIKDCISHQNTVTQGRSSNEGKAVKSNTQVLSPSPLPSPLPLPEPRKELSGTVTRKNFDWGEYSQLVVGSSTLAVEITLPAAASISDVDALFGYRHDPPVPGIKLGIAKGFLHDDTFQQRENWMEGDDSRFLYSFIPLMRIDAVDWKPLSFKKKLRRLVMTFSQQQQQNNTN